MAVLVVAVAVAAEVVPIAYYHQQRINKKTPCKESVKGITLSSKLLPPLTIIIMSRLNIKIKEQKPNECLPACLQAIFEYYQIKISE
ncbi:hypothetical protein KKB43_06470, partial [Patescibacteria group bacterium]|nr:hypothetical protein [Patescibacteria group bacterium]